LFLTREIREDGEREQDFLIGLSFSRRAEEAAGMWPGLAMDSGAFLLGRLVCYAQVFVSGEQKVTSG
jgi:hypothetical protein